MPESGSSNDERTPHDGAEHRPGEARCLDDDRMEPPVEANGDHESRRDPRLRQTACLVAVDRHGLLEVQVLLRLERAHRERGVGGGRRGHDDRVDVVAFDEIGGGVERRSARNEPSGALERTRIRIGDRRHDRPWQPACVPQVHRDGVCTAAGDAEPDPESSEVCLAMQLEMHVAQLRITRPSRVAQRPRRRPGAPKRRRGARPSRAASRRRARANRPSRRYVSP